MSTTPPRRPASRRHILAAQAVVSTVIALLDAFIPTVSSAYRIFTALATQVYLIMYLLMLIAAARLRRAQPDPPRGYRACAEPAVHARQAVIGDRVPDRIVSPSQRGHTSPLVYAVLTAAGILALGILPPQLLHRFRKPAWKATTVKNGAQP